MQSINSYMSDMLIEGSQDNIIMRNLQELTDQDIIEDLREYVANNIDPAHALDIYNRLKKILRNKTSLWQIPNIADIDQYDKACHNWAKNIIKKYKFNVDDENILVGIAYIMNSL